MGEASEMSGMSEVSTAETGKGGAGGGGSKVKILVPVVLLLLLLAIVGVVLITGSSDDTAQKSSEGGQEGDGTSSGTSSGGSDSEGPPKPPTKPPFKGANKVLFCFVVAERTPQHTRGWEFPGDGVCTHLIYGGNGLLGASASFQHDSDYDRFVAKLQAGEYRTTEGGLSVDIRNEQDAPLSIQKLQKEYDQKMVHYGAHYLKKENALIEFKNTSVNYMKSVRKFHEHVSPERISKEAENPLYGFISLQQNPYDPTKPVEMFELAQKVEDILGYPLLFLMHTNIEKPLNGSIDCLMGGTPLSVPMTCKRPSLTDYMNLMKTFTFKKNSRTAATFNMAPMEFTVKEDVKAGDLLSSLNLTAAPQGMSFFRSEVCDDYTVILPVDDTMKVEARANGKKVAVYDSEDTLKTKLTRLASHRPGTHLGYALFYTEFDNACGNGPAFELLKKFQTLSGIRRK